ncbi:restriction endonuclease subunit S [Marinomonas pollencensis]|uniref:Type I restriction enzyme S subunit n=1 Tax=Marinomonas pollencensis TaxID=491954 RepID=A0A3E0DV66_9GAMM|nr:restriction endonuclease subunit S [Marinomonas pollencensis]REG85549.1 type I restriction enzyme S subunit [Marinomonas pollencensis]
MERLALMPKYEAYKNSGVEWLGAIPVHWNSFPLCAKSKLKSISNNENEELLSVYLDKGVIKFDDVDAKRTNATSSDLTKYQLVEPGDFVLNNQQAWRGSVGVSDYRGIVSPAYLVLSLSEDIVPRFGNYLFRDGAMVANYLVSSKGVGTIQRNLYWPQLKRALVFLPPTEEQLLIACFLDKKTAQIDDAIAIKEQQISLLKERKQIIIQQAVTQGLDPNVPMKDSGVDWIGMIPAHWVLKKIKHVASKIGSGVTPTGGGSTYLDDGIPLLRSQNIHFDRIDLTDVARISNKTHEGMSNSKVKKGDVLLNITGGSIGRCYYVDSSDEMNVNQHVCIVRPNKIIKTVFLNAVLASEIGQGQIWYFQQGGGREGLNFQALKNFYIALPPEAQQVEIAEYIDELEKEFYSAIQIQLMQIEKLKEYKTSLINSAVTGKIKITPEMVEQ